MFICQQDIGRVESAIHLLVPGIDGGCIGDKNLTKKNFLSSSVIYAATKQQIDLYIKKGEQVIYN